MEQLELPFPFLDNWALVSEPKAYQAPEQAEMCLYGTVTGHPDHEDGKQVTTSPVLTLDIDRGIAVTRSRAYRLGKPDPRWLSWLTENGYTLGNIPKKEESAPEACSPSGS